MNPVGGIDHKGLSATVMFFKGLLEKLNIDLQIFRLGKFKSAIEPFTLDKMSNENREQLKLMLNSINNNIMDSISSQRQIPFEMVKKHANQLTLNSCHNLPYLTFHHVQNMFLYLDIYLVSPSK